MLEVPAKENQFNAVFHIRKLKEHVLLCKGSGIDSIIVAVNLLIP